MCVGQALCWNAHQIIVNVKIVILQKLHELNILMYEKYGSDNADRQYVNANGIASQLWNPDKSGEKHKDLSAILAFQDVHNQACMTWRYEKRSFQSKD